jgi:peptide/nickel transport system substrate-binding protein
MRHIPTAARTTLAVATSLAALAALAGCTGEGGPTVTGQAQGKDTLVLGMTADIQGWDISNQPSYQGWHADAVFEKVFNCDAKAEPAPGLAESWEFNADKTQVTLHLRPGRKFTDGAAVDAASVKASVEYSQSHGGQAKRLADWKASAPDPLTAVIDLSEPDPLFTAKLCNNLIITSAKAIKAGNLNKAPVGSGPYKLDAAATTRGSVYSFVKDESYWNAKSYPYKKLRIKVITNETAVVNALKTGQIDGSLIQEGSYNEAEAAGLKIQTLRGNTTRLLLTDHQGKKIPALGEVDVRRAMNMVFDKKAMAKGLLKGRAAPAHQIFRPGSTAYVKDLKDPYPYDVKAAKALMKKAGYADGFTLELPYMQGVGLEKLVPVVKQQLGLLNIKVKQETLSGPNAISELLSGKYPVPLWNLGNYGDSRQDISDYLLTDGIWNVSHQPDGTVSKLWDTIASGSEKEAAKAQQDLDRYVVDQAWFVPMMYPDGFYAYSSKIDVQPSSDYSALHPLLRDFK